MKHDIVMRQGSITGKYTVTTPINTQWCYDIISLRITETQKVMRTFSFLSKCRGNKFCFAAIIRVKYEGTSRALDLIHEGCFYEVSA